MADQGDVNYCDNDFSMDEDDVDRGDFQPDCQTTFQEPKSFIRQKSERRDDQTEGCQLMMQGSLFSGSGFGLQDH